jgi:hypothetical protein
MKSIHGTHQHIFSHANAYGVSVTIFICHAMSSGVLKKVDTENLVMNIIKILSFFV